MPEGIFQGECGHESSALSAVFSLFVLLETRTDVSVSVRDSSVRFGSSGQLFLAWAAFYLAGLNGAALSVVEDIQQPRWKVTRQCCKLH